MPQSLILILLLFALALPVLGAIVLRVLGPRLTLAQLYAGAALILGVAIASVLVLARADIPSLQIGSLSILLPDTAPDDSDLALAPPLLGLDATVVPQPPAAAPAAEAATAAPPTPTAAASPIATATAAPPTAAPTAVPEPTAIPPTPVPPTQAPAPAAGPRMYTVQPGDTLLAIAEKFNTTVPALVKANKLTPQQADSLSIGQELLIP